MSHRRGSNLVVQSIAHQYATRIGHGAKASRFAAAPNDNGAGGVVTAPLDPSARSVLNNSSGTVLLRKNADGTFSPVARD